MGGHQDTKRDVWAEGPEPMEHTWHEDQNKAYLIPKMVTFAPFLYIQIL